MKTKIKYKNTVIVFLIIVLTIVIGRFLPLKLFVVSLGQWGYLGAFVAGIFFTFSFTIAPSGLVIYFLASYLNRPEVALFAGIGAVLGDLAIFRFFRNDLYEECLPFFRKLSRKFLNNSERRVLKFFLPIIGALVIASPLPDEVGVGLMGISKIKSWQFVILSFVLNSAVIYLLISVIKAAAH